MIDQTSYALPIGFGINQGPIRYNEITSNNFLVYLDRRTPQEGFMVMESLEAARNPLELWFGSKRTRPLPVILSAVTENASFANFLTDVLEIQSLGQGPKSLFLHEYVHQGMYRTLDNFLGPIGNIIHLPWLPAWFIEGLADSLALTVGSDGMAGIERYQALSGDWPSYDRLHSLYTSGSFSARGYATSAGMVRFLLKKIGPDRLSLFMHQLRANTMPWWWPVSVVPYLDTMPFDRALKEFAGLNGRDFYELYKKEAKNRWESLPGSFYLEPAVKGQVRPMSVQGPSTFDPRLAPLVQEDGKKGHHGTAALIAAGSIGKSAGWQGDDLEFDDKYDFIVGRSEKAGEGEKTSPVKSDFMPEIEYEYGENYDLFTKFKFKEKIFKRKGFVSNLSQSKTDYIWLETVLSKMSLCLTRKNSLAKNKFHVVCPLQVKMPQSLKVIGGKPVEAEKRNILSTLWLTISEERLTGNVYKLAFFDAATKKITIAAKNFTAPPVDVAFVGADTWLLVSERYRQTLRKVDADLNCQSMILTKDHLLGIRGLDDKNLIMRLYAGSETWARRINPREQPLVPCEIPLAPVSPLEVAMGSAKPIALSVALAGSEIWVDEVKNPNKAEKMLQKEPSSVSEKPLGKAAADKYSIKKQRWRGRPVFLVPWIGAEDALGYQLGVISVPLMDHLQNETIRATVLVGAASRFPYQEVTLTSTRFRPTYNLAVYRQQSYNGQLWIRSTNQIKTSYLDEKGVRIEVSRPLRLGDTKVSLSGGLKVADLKPYLGPSILGRGVLVEPMGSIEFYKTIFDDLGLSTSLSGRVAPKGLNKTWDYNQIGFSSGLSIPLSLWNSSASVGIEGSRTRGIAQRDYAEIYRPLKTFIPGSGGGYNQNNFPIVESGSGLFASQNGDTQGRFKGHWTVPVVPDVDRMFWLIYADRLDFTAFYNYGGAWDGAKPSQGFAGLTSAHGYNLDLQMENKGVRFNMGLGTGQVRGQPFEVYMTTGFDALF